MKKIRPSFAALPLFITLLVSGCANQPSSGWPEYREAMRCHLESRNEECDRAYEAAIKLNPKLPGLQSSYASHLYRRGDVAGAEEHFRAELENHPKSGKAIKVVVGK